MRVIGRESEVAQLSSFLDESPADPSVVLLEGEPGIGKTTLWRELVEDARRRDMMVLSARPAQPETALPFVTLQDLLEGVVDEVSDELPGPQQHALRSAVFTEESGPSPDQRTVSVGVLNAVRLLASNARLLVAIDDVQWADTASASVLSFALRRLDSDRIRVFMTLRLEEGLEGSGFTDPVSAAEVLRWRLGPLTVDATHRLIRERLGLVLSRPTVRRVHQLSGGNPFFALEIARSPALEGLARGDNPSVPATLRDLLLDRVGGLSKPTRETIIAVSLLSQPTEELLERAVGPEVARRGLRGAVAAEVIETKGKDLRLTHPLLGSVLYEQLSPTRQRQLHGELALIVPTLEERARHLALSTSHPDADVADALEEAALNAKSRGATAGAAELFDMARRLTPLKSVRDIERRTMAVARFSFLAGDLGRAREELDLATRDWPPGPLRAEALRLRAHIAFVSESVVTSDRLLHEARGEAGSDDHTLATIERDLSLTTLMLGDLPRALQHARSSLDLAKRLGQPGLLAQALAMTASIDFILGNGLSEDICAQALALERPDPEADAVLQASGAIGAALAIADDFRAARERLLILLQRARDLGEESTVAVSLMALADVEARTGDLPLAEAYGEESAEISVQIGARHSLVHGRAAVALVSALRGEVERARATAEEGLSLAAAVDSAGGMVLNLSVLGLLDLSLGDFQAAADRLAPVAQMALVSGFGEPGTARFIPDYIEALISLGRIEEARPLVGQLEERGRALNRAAALGAVARFHALILAAEGALEAATASAEESIQHYERVELPLELGRSHLAAGEVNRGATERRGPSPLRACPGNLRKHGGSPMGGPGEDRAGPGHSRRARRPRPHTHGATSRRARG
jgi:tetratricopeptide (TPR) repeat protein